MAEEEYRCSRYSYRCDIYLPELDYFIECHYFWTHGGRLYDETKDYCKTQLLEWSNRAKTSKKYRDAIHTWTKADPQKLKHAMDNHLNYKIVYTREEFKEFLSILVSFCSFTKSQINSDEFLDIR